jgi:hypothetical protein
MQKLDGATGFVNSLLDAGRPVDLQSFEMGHLLHAVVGKNIGHLSSSPDRKARADHAIFSLNLHP